MAKKKVKQGDLVYSSGLVFKIIKFVRNGHSKGYIFAKLMFDTRGDIVPFTLNPKQYRLATEKEIANAIANGLRGKGAWANV